MIRSPGCSCLFQNLHPDHPFKTIGLEYKSERDRSEGDEDEDEEESEDEEEESETDENETDGHDANDDVRNVRSLS